jgi:phage regulator Rha-like protein
MRIDRYDEEMKHNDLTIIPVERIENKIFYIRGKKVMFDDDLAELYGVETKVLNKAVKRNSERFPDEDFVFQLNKKEFENFESLRFQIGTSNRGGRRYLPFVFTEQGVAMLSSVLTSKRAIRVNILIIKTFTRLRELVASNKELREKIEEMERRVEKRLGVHDEQLKAIFEAIQKLLTPPDEKKEYKIGFGVE